MKNILQIIALLFIATLVFSSCGHTNHEEVGPSDDTPDWGIPVDETPDWGIPADSIPGEDIPTNVDGKYRNIHTNRNTVTVSEYEILENSTKGFYQRIEYNRSTFEVVGVRHYAFDARVGVKEDPSGENKRFVFTPSTSDIVTEIKSSADYECKEIQDPSAWAMISFEALSNGTTYRINDFSFSLCEVSQKDIYDLHQQIKNEI